MSTLGDDIRAQQRAADTLSSNLTQCASGLRAQIHATDWTSDAAERCRSTLQCFATAIDRLSSASTNLARALSAHATSVETQEVMDALNPAATALRVPAHLNTKATCTILPPREPESRFPIGQVLQAPKGAR